MSAAAESDHERINLRLKRSAKTALEHAASLEGKTVSSFILNTAMARADETIQAHAVMTLNKRDSEAFLNALARPVQFNKTLSAALAEHDRHVTSR